MSVDQNEFQALGREDVNSVESILADDGVDFGVLGAQETCNGDPARRLGNEFLYQLQVQANGELFNTLNVKKVITHCPHCFNTFRNEYPDYGVQFEVTHHSEFLQGLIAQGKLKPKNAFGQRVISTIFTQSNQYRVILEADPALQQSPLALDAIYLPSSLSSTGQVPLSSIAIFRPSDRLSSSRATISSTRSSR